LEQLFRRLYVWMHVIELFVPDAVWILDHGGIELQKRLPDIRLLLLFVLFVFLKPFFLVFLQDSVFGSFEVSQVLPYSAPKVDWRLGELALLPGSWDSYDIRLYVFSLDR
jgi:hypothetical protein